MQENQLPTTEQVRAAMRTLHQSSPEAALVVQRALDACHSRVQILSNDDAFRGYLLARAQQDGAVAALLQRIDSSLLSELAKAESSKAQQELLEAQDRANRTITLRSALSEPVVLALVGVISTGMTGLFTLVSWLIGANP